MMAHTENPYQSPQTPTADTSPPAKPAEVGWKQIARRWEILRLPYNVIVGLAGLLALAMIPTLSSREIIVGVVAYVNYTSFVTPGTAISYSPFSSGLIGGSASQS